MQMTKKVLALLLAVLLSFGTFAMTASAESGGVLELTAGTDKSGDGWTWDGTANTLMLFGATFDDCVWLKVASATLVLADGTENIMRGGSYGNCTADNHGDGVCWSGIYVGTALPDMSNNAQNCNRANDGILTIKGNGKLTMKPTTTDIEFSTFAINCHKLTIGDGSDHPVLEYVAQRSYFHSYALQAFAGFTLNSGDVDITCGDFEHQGWKWYGCGVFVRSGGANAIVINDGSLKVHVIDGSATCKGLAAVNGGNVTINGGTVDIAVTGNGASGQ